MDVAEARRLRLKNLGLAQPLQGTPETVVRHLVAMQSQDYGPAKWSVAQRCRELSDADVEDALARGLILRTHVLRPTWHVVARDDIRWLLQLTGPRIAKQIAPRLRELGLDARTLSGCQKHFSAALEGNRHLTREELRLELEQRGTVTTGQRLPYILIWSELDGLICSGRSQGTKQTYALLDERVPEAAVFEREGATIDLIRRYLESHGPATVSDLRWWSSLTVADIKAGLEALGSGVSSATLDGLTVWWIDDASNSAVESKGAFLLQAYDESIVGYRDSRFIGDPRAALAIAAWKDRSIPSGLVLINGKIAGHWRRRLEPRQVVIDAALYGRPGRTERELLQTEADGLGAFLDRTTQLRVSTL